MTAIIKKKETIIDERNDITSFSDIFDVTMFPMPAEISISDNEIAW